MYSTAHYPIKTLPQVECNILLDDFSAVTETTNAVEHLSSDNVTGSDAIPAEIYKAYKAGQTMAKKKKKKKKN